VNLVDANVLLYAVNVDASDHRAARAWLEDALSGGGSVLFPWVSLLAFMRVLTHPRIHPNPASWTQARGFVDEWLASPNAWVPHPDERHLERLTSLLAPLGRGGNIINDAHLAALALQYDATVITFDADFARFPGVATRNPATG
jgi:toxin-antitoxin system PIN domain toxin